MSTAEKKRKILIIDDEEIVLDSCLAILADTDYEVQTANDGNAGVKLVKEFEPDLVFVDLKMPGISGFDVLKQIEKIDSTVVAIVITGYATVSSAVDAMKGGAYDFLPKPFTPDEFRLITKRGMEKRALVLETMALRREREMLRENFAAIVSHELKSPIGAIQQNLYVLTRELTPKFTDEQAQRLQKMMSRIDDLVKLIHTWLRDISVDINRIKVNFKPIALANPLSTAVETNAQHAKRKDVQIVVSGAESAATVKGDEGTLTEAFVNVIGNAVKYSHVGGKVDVTVENKDGSIVVSVADTGIGMAEEDLPYIFDGLYRAKSARTTHSGTGFGLAISRRIIEAHDGTITVQSKLAKGTTFVITLPTVESGTKVERVEPQ
jgi:two-component system sensor histidine kinase/response regulator